MVAATFDPHPMAVLRPEHAPMSLTDIERRSLLLERRRGGRRLRDPVLPRDRGLDPGGVHRPRRGRRPARRPRGGRRELPVRCPRVRRRLDPGRGGQRRRTSRSRASRSTGDPRSGPRRTCAPAWPPATSRAPRRRWVGRSRWWATSCAATCAAASSATRPPTSPRATPPLPRTGCTPAGCVSSTRRVGVAAGGDQRRHQPDLRRSARAPGRGLRARPHRPRPLRRAGRDLLRRPDPRDGQSSTASRRSSRRWPATWSGPATSSACSRRAGVCGSPESAERGIDVRPVSSR